MTLSSAFIGLLAIAAPVAAQPVPGYYQLPQVQGVNPLTTAVADGGRAVGGYTAAFLPPSDRLGFTYRPDTGYTVYGGPGYPVETEVTGISATGAFAAGRATIPVAGGLGGRAFRTGPDGGFDYFGLLPGGDDSCRATAISADGQTVVGYSARFGSIERERAFVWTPAVGTRQIPDLRPDGRTTIAMGISSGGDFVVGHSSSGNLDSSAFIWSVGTGSIELPGFTSGYGSEARGVTPGGNIVVGYSDLRAARWTNGVIEDLGLLPGYTIGASANYISDDGSLIAGSINAPSATGLLNTSFVFSDGRGMQLANDFFAGHGVVLPGTIFAITDMSPDGTAFSVRLYDSFADYVVVIPAAPSAFAFAVLVAVPSRRRR